MVGQGKTRFLCKRQDELMEHWWNGENDHKIAKMVGCTPSAICQWRKVHDLPPNCNRGRQW